MSSLLGAALLLALLPGTGFSATYNLTYILDITTNWPGSDYIQQRNLIQSPNPGGARWARDTYPLTNASGLTIAIGPDSPQWVSVIFSPVPNYYLPAVSNTYLDDDMGRTNYYVPYSNTLAVTITGTNGMTSNVLWSFSSPPAELTNSTASKSRYTNNATLVPIPNGSYSITFPPMSGFATPAGAVTTNITGASPWTNTLTYAYLRLTNGTIVVTPNLTNATWAITNHPADYTGSLSGTGSASIASVPAGTYSVRFNPVPGMSTPASVTRVVNDDTQTFTGNYGQGRRLTVHIYDPNERDPVPPYTGFPGGSSPNYPEGIGYGTYDLNESAKTNGVFIDGSWYFSDGVSVNITAIPTNYNDGLHNYTSFYYRAYSRYLVNGDPAYDYYTTYSASDNPISGLVMNGDYDVWILFSRVYFWFDPVGDVDGDGLPDEWEVTCGLNPLSITTTNGWGGNADGDWIPSASTNPPTLIAISSNLVTSYLAADGSDPGYPLRGNRLYNPLLAANDGYARTNNAFHNGLECRGLDGYYKTNGPAGWVANDDPYTDPRFPDTINQSSLTKMDGWRYYFWYWRSANAYEQGLTNSANLDWVRIFPSMTRGTPTDPEYDTDNDGVADGLEYTAGLDPTHADTDADSMDDTWERQFVTVCHPLNALDGMTNADNDYYAVSSTLRILSISNWVGTLLSTSVYYVGAEANPLAAWIDSDTNTGEGRFDLYRDLILCISTNTTVRLTNGVLGTKYSHTAYYGLTNNLPGYKSGYPVWVDIDNNIHYSAGDAALVNPLIKNEDIYKYALTNALPGMTSFDPRTAYSTGVGDTNEHPNTAGYINYQEYMGGDYLGRVFWNPGGNIPNVGGNIDGDGVPSTRTAYTNPNGMDTDNDLMPDGWELYVALNPNNVGDAVGDGDGDKLLNRDEWANATISLGSCAATWPAKVWPTDPGVIVAPAPNDPHPMDTDWDALTDNAELNSLNPNSFDTDSDGMPDGWEVYAGSNPTNADASVDTDGDGLVNMAEYFTGTMAEWMYCDPRWIGLLASNVRFDTRPCMPWDPLVRAYTWPYIPPDFLSDPSFLYQNNISMDLAYLRASYPAAGTLGSIEYHTTLANDRDSDWDGMDDFWEVYHGLNPCLGTISLMIPVGETDIRHDWFINEIGELDAGIHSDAHDFQVGFEGDPFSSLPEFFSVISTTNLFLRTELLDSMVGPFNCGLGLMDPDADGLPNMEEYSYSSNRPFYHTDPSPLWRTDRNDDQSFVSRHNYSQILVGRTIYLGYLSFESNEGFDTDHDDLGDYAEINSLAGGTGNDPLDARNPIRNRALFLDGIGDFARTPDAWSVGSESYLTRFCVEAWIKPDRPMRSGEQVIIERSSQTPNPFNQSVSQVSANFKLGITNGLPFIMYNGRGALRVHQATAALRHQIQPGTNWTHVAGVYDGSDLIIYVNGENSATVPTAEIPDTGIDTVYGSNYTARGSSLIIGAEDPNASDTYINTAPRNFYGGCIDELRVWDGSRSRADILAHMNQRLSWDQIARSPLFVYCTFDDVPDPYHRNRDGVLDEPVAPANMMALDTNMRLHPAIPWWRDYANRSTVYTGVSNSYNYIIQAQNHADHLARRRPYDDVVHVNTNPTTNATSDLPADYKNPTNPYGVQSTEGIPILADFVLFRGARGVATNSWLTGLSNDPDSTDTDGDGLPDWWEIQYGLDPYDATGDNGAWGDPDHDGLNNRSEYLAGTNPKAWDTDGDGNSDYDSRRGPGTRTWGEIYDDGDSMPDTWEILNGLDPNYYDANLDPDNDGWSNYAEYQAGTNPKDPTSRPWSSVSGTVHYYGTNNLGLSRIRVWGMSGTNFMDAANGFAAQCDQYGKFTLTGLVEGPFKLFAFLDINNDSAWSGVVANDKATTEPCGQSEDHPYDLGWTSISNTRVGVSDTCPGYTRALWQNRTTSTPSVVYPLGVNKISESDAPQVLYKGNATVQLGEWDFQDQGIYGLAAGTYQWWVGPNYTYHALFNVTWPSSLAQPYLVYPRGDNLYYARNMITWTMDPNSTLYHLQVAHTLSNGSLYYDCDTYYPAPYREANGSYRAYLPDDVCEWPNGVYYWRIASWNPQSESAWSDVQTFRLDLQSTNSYWISGDIQYFGKGRATNIYVEAYDNPGFGGVPDARVLYRLDCVTNALKASFTLRGLQSKVYYVRAFADITPAGGGERNGKLDFWESWGFVKNPDSDYQPFGIALTNTHMAENTKVVLRDRDTDNDHLPDAWEMSYFGNLNQTGDMDYDNDGENNLTEYALDFLDTDPTLFDTDCDGLTDYFEHHYGNNPEYDPYDAISNPGGKSLNPTRWDTDGDAYSDGAEIRRYHTDPLKPASRPGYAPLCVGPVASPADYDGDGRTDVSLYDPASGVWSILTWNGQTLSGQFGSPTTQPLMGDFDGDGRTDAALYDPPSGTWHVYTILGQSASLAFGDSQMIPVPADYDGDFKTDLGVFDVPTGMWYLYAPFTGQFTQFQFGNAACIPAPGDYDGDGKYDVAVYHVPDNTWYIYTWRGEFTQFQLGHSGCIPVPGDYDGDGRFDFAVYDVTTATWYIYTWNRQFASGQFGWNGVIPVPGDYDGDGRRDAGVYDPASGMWFIYTMAGQQYQGQFGAPPATPVVRGR